MADKKLYRVQIMPNLADRKVYTLHCETVDFNMTPWVVIRGICLPVKSSIIQISNEDYERFHDVKTLTIPYTSLNSCEELHEQQARDFWPSSRRSDPSDA